MTTINSKAAGGSILLLSMLLLNNTASAVEKSHDSIQIMLTGILKESVCSFGSKPIDVEFGDVFIGQINSAAYSQKIGYTLTCRDDQPDGMAFTMSIDGAPAGFDSSLLGTDISGIGIKLLHDEKQVKPNEGFSFDEKSPPQLTAVLVQDETAKLTEGEEFTGSATLKVEWQ